MKRTFMIGCMLCLLLYLALTALPMSVASEEVAEDATSGNWDTNITWSFDQATGTLTISGTGKMKDCWPSYDAYPWAVFRTEIRSLVIEDGVTFISQDAFRGCTSLTNVSIADSVTEMGPRVFQDCTALTNIVFPKNLTIISGSTLEGCSALATVHIPEGVVQISSFAFRGCTSLGAVDFPETLKYIQGSVFSGCTGLTSVTFPKGVFSISDYAFKDCTGLQKLVFVGNAPRIGSYTFEGVKLQAFFPIEDATWYESNVLTDYQLNILWTGSENPGNEEINLFAGTCGRSVRWKLEDGVMTIFGSGPMEYVPWGMHQKKITKVIIEDGVSSIYNSAFYYCSNMTDITIPTSVTKIGGAAFYRCKGLTGITIPDGVTSMGSIVFAGCENLKEISLPDSMTKIANRAFEDCVALTYIKLPDNMEAIADRTFWGCTGLQKIQLPKNLRVIGESAFYNCNQLKEITIPERVHTIKDTAFAHCTSLNVIYFRGNEPDIQGFAAFSKVDAYLYYPSNNPTWTKNSPHTTTNGYLKLMPYGVSGVQINGEPEGETVTLLAINTQHLKGQTRVWVNGVEYPVEIGTDTSYVHLPEEAGVKVGMFVTTYTYHEGDGQDIHTQYPTGMQTWVVKEYPSNAGFYAQGVLLDDILQYAGSSIRISGNKGIRMITAIEKSRKNELIDGGVSGYTLVEYGTALCWAKDLEGGKPMTLGQPYVKSNYAYKYGVADPVFATTDDMIQYTNVLVGFTQDQCKEDIAMRPYMTLVNYQGFRVTLYGGIVYRSIGYIAYQNRNAFQPKTNAYNFVWEIIHHVYGDQYDADYKG